MSMIRISTSTLKPGMFTIDPGLDWMQYPYLYMTEGMVASDDEVRRILDEGYKEVYIDPVRSTVVPSPAEFTADVVLPPPSPTAIFRKPKVALKEELSVAAAVHDEGVAYARSFMKDMRAGRLSLEPAARLVENIMDSLDRNADALVTLSRLRRTDSYTYMHCVNVCVLVGLFSRHLGHDESKAYASGFAGLFHDLGKSLIPLTILNAARKLNRVEWNVMKSHPTLGYEQLAVVPGMKHEVLFGTLHHHEKFDGSGYPAGLAGDEVSDIGSMVGVADIYDALTSKRSYKEAMHPHRALGIMYEMRNKDLREDLLESFIRMLGVYPMGSVVELDDGTMGVVSETTEKPSHPVVTVVRDPLGKTTPPVKRDLSRQDNKLMIIRCVAPEAAGIDPAQVLGIGT